MNMIEKMFCEDNGTPSSMRLVVFLVVCTVLFNWTYMNIVKETLHSFQAMDIGALVAPFLFKVWQKGKEK